MSSTSVLFNMRSLQVPDNLNITGRGLTPTRPPSPPSPEDTAMLSIANSSRTSLSDEETFPPNEEYTVLDGVREMNQILVRQIETLRLKIKVDEKNYDQDKERLRLSKENEVRAKENEIEELRESVSTRDDAIQQLTRAAEEKDRTIQSKCAEIEELKGMVRQTKEYANRMQKQVTQAKKQRQNLESDPLYQQQNEEISKLTKELEMLRQRLGDMEGELARALTIIEQQNTKLQTLDSERAALHEQFREDLEKASRAMRQEVERMREVMRQNYDEMRNLRQQNKDMHENVREILDMLKSPQGQQHINGHGIAGNFHNFPQETLVGHPRPITVSHGQSSGYSRHTHGQSTVASPAGPGRMIGASLTNRKSASENRRGLNSRMAPNSVLRESTDFVSRDASGVGAASGVNVDSSGYYSAATTARASPDTARSSRVSLTVSGQASRQNAQQNKTTRNDGYYQSGAGEGRSLPAICSVKEGVAPPARQPSGRGRPILRKGSSIVRKQ